jgi:hypothetical protein
LGLQVEEQEILRQYLLGDLPAESQRSLEERLMTDGELYDELLMAEDDLVDQYLAGVLSGGAREAFERRFLATPECRRKLNFASALRKHIAAAEPPRPEAEQSEPSPPARRSLLQILFPPGRPAVGWAWATVLLLAVTAASFVVVRTWRGRVTGGPEIAARVFNVELKPGAVRRSGEEMRRIAPPADAAVVRLELESASGEGRGYRATLLADDGRTLLSRDNLEAREQGGARYVPFDIPAGLLTRGDYRVKLSRLAAGDATPEDLASYSFRVAR